MQRKSPFVGGSKNFKSQSAPSRDVNRGTSVVWIRFDSSIFGHAKTEYAAELLGIDDEIMVVRMARLWLQVADTAPDGLMAGWSRKYIARKARWKGDPEKFVQTLIDVGFIDETPDGLAIHNWGKWAEPYKRRKQKQKERGAERARKAELEKLANERVERLELILRREHEGQNESLRHEYERSDTADEALDDIGKRQLNVSRDSRTTSHDKDALSHDVARQGRDSRTTSHDNSRKHSGNSRRTTSRDSRTTVASTGRDETETRRDETHAAVARRRTTVARQEKARALPPPIPESEIAKTDLTSPPELKQELSGPRFQPLGDTLRNLEETEAWLSMHSGLSIGQIRETSLEPLRKFLPIPIRDALSANAKSKEAKNYMRYWIGAVVGMRQDALRDAQASPGGHGPHPGSAAHGNPLPTARDRQMQAVYEASAVNIFAGQADD